MKKSYILIILISFLVISPKLYAQVECPCDFGAIPKTQECWGTLDGGSQPEYFSVEGPLPREGTICVTFNFGSIDEVMLEVENFFEPISGTIRRCSRRIDNNTDPENCLVGDIFSPNDLTPEQVIACQCELLAYTTALNEVAGISVSGGPPYVCGDVDCRQKVLTPIPTLNEYGMIITAGVLGLLAVIGLFVIRRRKAAA